MSAKNSNTRQSCSTTWSHCYPFPWLPNGLTALSTNIFPLVAPLLPQFTHIDSSMSYTTRIELSTTPQFSQIQPFAKPMILNFLHYFKSKEHFLRFPSPFALLTFNSPLVRIPQKRIKMEVKPNFSQFMRWSLLLPDGTQKAGISIRMKSAVNMVGPLIKASPPFPVTHFHRLTSSCLALIE